MVLFFVCGSKTFCIKDKYLDRLTVGSETIYWRSPDPNTLNSTNISKCKFSIFV